jgi:hypothetical protein
MYHQRPITPEEWTVADQLEFENLVRHFPVLQKFVRLKGRHGMSEVGMMPKADDPQFRLSLFPEKTLVGDALTMTDIGLELEERQNKSV